ncbi:hypothetical protein D8674_006213 [Pyrus ussuriensis x Pyrus communis]|uniref:Uncharacterized protein n=1 Tax=Pyrus ussuriensis x Pyrus communis TaxID=2448454 RepID=A0A5N5FTN2_9ROSA|nr:hypothetical protein D8674_006213 [Pyrus ussuriensis x Pyrus communis]
MRTGRSDQDCEQPHLVGDGCGQRKLHSHDIKLLGSLFIFSSVSRVTILQAKKEAIKSFPYWFEKHVNQLQQSGDPRAIDDLVALANGPSKWCQRYKIFVCNGFRFKVRGTQSIGKYQNYGKQSDVPNCYGVLTDVFEIKYHMERTVDVEHATGDNDELHVVFGRNTQHVRLCTPCQKYKEQTRGEKFAPSLEWVELDSNSKDKELYSPQQLFAVELNDKLEKIEPIEPPHTVARFSRFIGMLASNMDRAWQRIKGTLDWTDAITLELEPKIRQVYEMKLNDRWKDYKANLKKAYYTPCLHSPLVERFHCHDGRVNQGQWKLLVQLWDTVDAQEQVNGSKPDRITFFTLTRTQKNGEPVDARLAAIIDKFNTNLKLYEDRNEIIIDEVWHIVYADVLGPDRETIKRGICREVEAIRASYEEQRKATNFEIERLKMEASEREERQRIEAANMLAQLRKKHAESMVAHNRRVELEVENMKREMRVEITSRLKKAADGGMVEPNRVDVTQVCVNRIEQGNDEGIAVLQNNGTDDEIGYRPCMVNDTGFSK